MRERDKSPDLSLLQSNISNSPVTDELRLGYAMTCNGYNHGRLRWWNYDTSIVDRISPYFEGMQTSFFGPDRIDAPFFSTWKVDPNEFHSALSQPEVNNALRRYWGKEGQFISLSFILGGLIRHLSANKKNTEDIGKAVKLTAQMAMLGDEHSVDAVIAATAMYIISGGSLERDAEFEKRVYHMAEAISEDPITPRETRDLGLSQVARLSAFSRSMKGEEKQSMPDVSELITPFVGFPTVGAEFHFLPSSIDSERPEFWRRLAILNMSQYQNGSFIQMSRNDRGVIEIRMNPSIYPIAVANWNWMRELMPELNHAQFWTTLNRPRKNFNWEKDKPLLDELKGLGLLTYAALLKRAPKTEQKGEISFGSSYLGQTVRLHKGEWRFDGMWGGENGDFGQVSIYSGLGETFETLAFLLSMDLTNQGFNLVGDKLRGIKTLYDAFNIDSKTQRLIFMMIENYISGNPRLRRLKETGKKITEILNP